MSKKHHEIFLVPEGMEQVSCDGGGALGHPKVWYAFAGRKSVVCHYCDCLFTKEPQAGAKPLKAA